MLFTELFIQNQNNACLHFQSIKSNIRKSLQVRLELDVYFLSNFPIRCLYYNFIKYSTLTWKTRMIFQYQIAIWINYHKIKPKKLHDLQSQVCSTQIPHGLSCSSKLSCKGHKRGRDFWEAHHWNLLEPSIQFFLRQCSCLIPLENQPHSLSEPLSCSSLLPFKFLETITSFVGVLVMECWLLLPAIMEEMIKERMGIGMLFFFSDMSKLISSYKYIYLN